MFSVNYYLNTQYAIFEYTDPLFFEHNYILTGWGFEYSEVPYISKSILIQMCAHKCSPISMSIIIIQCHHNITFLN